MDGTGYAGVRGHARSHSGRASFQICPTQVGAKDVRQASYRSSERGGLPAV